ncbi:putative transposase [Orientia tsutsugamushi str. Gilliam]|uniref:Putative transposase n=1 Tax=Orientia tsutsugamushi str. Gilliam TaxID=1359184 RepID=A0A0F3MC81_ORITS|nr:putative transposase [Orientia tsutsugamushi str. Gilliam]
MKFDQIKELKDEKFRRLTGVRKGTFFKDGGYFEESLMVLRIKRWT